jgi:hypothetical protein
MKKKWTKEEFIKATRDHREAHDPLLLQKQERRRQWLKKKRNRHGKSKP